jgi:THO complex subunit 3
VQSVAWNCTGRKLATGSVDQSARIWAVDATASVGRNSESLRSESELKGHTDSVDQLCWDPVNENTLATASCDKSVRFWDVRSGKCSMTVSTPVRFLIWVV